MDWIEYFKLIGLTSIPITLLLIAIVFMGRKFIDSYFQSSVDSYKNELELLSRKNAFVFEKIHERKIQAIDETYSKLGVLYKKLLFLTAQMKMVPEGKTYDQLEDELIQDFAKHYENFNDAYLANQLFLSDKSCKSIEKILKEFRVASAEYNSLRFMRNHEIKGETLAKSFKESAEASKKVQHEFPKALEQLKESFNLEMQKFDIQR